MKPDQAELFGQDEGGFRLIQETALDGERITNELKQKEEDLAESDKRQLQLGPDPSEDQ